MLIQRPCHGSAASVAIVCARLGVEHFGQSGSLSELYGHYGLDVNAILTAAEGMSGRPVRYRFLQT